MAHWGLGGAQVTPIGRGLINETYLVAGASERVVLQRVSRIFDPAIHANILAVTRRLADQGVATPELRSTGDGAACLDLGRDGGVWRVLSYMDGAVFDSLRSEQAWAAGNLVARFHGALDGLDHRFCGMRVGVHDAQRHLAHLAEALRTHGEHRLFAVAEALARELFAAAEALPPMPSLPQRICHGDLKANNVIFEGAAPPASNRAVCLVDLDTVGPGSLGYELGDAWRSWCNRAGEDVPEAELDLGIFRASLDGYRDGGRRALTDDECRALLLGPEWVSLNLAVRFCADVLGETYFGWNRARFPGRGEHNLVRARGQWSLHRAFVATRSDRALCFG